MKKTIFDTFVERCENNEQLEVLELLKDSDRHHRVTRKELVDKLHRHDASIRHTIEQMRANGVFIAADMTEAGYYIPQSFGEYIVFEDAYMGRARTIFFNKRKMRRLAVELLSGQTRMGGIE